MKKEVGKRGAWGEVEGMRKTRQTHVVKEFGKDRKNCLWVMSCNETMRVAKRSRVSWGEVGGHTVREGMRKEEENVPLGMDALALWSSSYGRRKPEDLVAWWSRGENRRGGGGMDVGQGRKRGDDVMEEKRGEGGKDQRGGRVGEGGAGAV